MAATPVQSPTSPEAERSYFVFNTDGQLVGRLTHIFDKVLMDSSLGYHLFIVEQNVADRSFSTPLLYEQKRVLEHGTSYKRSYMPLKMAGLEEAYRFVIDVLNGYKQRNYLSKKETDQQDEKV